MEILSIRFLLFFVGVLVVYYFLPRRAQNILLLIASYFFCLTWSPYYTVVLAVVSIANYYLARRMEESTRRKNWLISGLVFNILPFIILKVAAGPYGKTIFDLFRLIPNTGLSTESLLPIGYSFYILQAISYLVDVYKRQIPPAGDLFEFALYMSFFPKMLAGPVERAQTFLPQLQSERMVDNRRFGRGLGLILVGLVRKAVIADILLRLRPADIFSSPEKYTASQCILWLLAFAFTLYNDFAGYTSIVRGMSELMGIELSPNFRVPFLARSASDFWNRWHLSLSRWLRDYLFFPLRRWLLTKRAPKLIALAIPPMITMLASGFWHGAHLSMLCWGGLYGLYLTLEQFGKGFIPKLPGGIKMPAFVPILGTFVLTTLTWIPFASSSFRTALLYFGKLSPPYETVPFSPFLLGLIAFSFLLSLFIDLQEEKTGEYSFFMKWTPTTQAIGFAIGALLILFLSAAGNVGAISNFIYQGF